MAYDAGLAERIRRLVVNDPSVAERKMFGGLCFTSNGHMCFGVVGEELMVRVGPDAWSDSLERPFTREMDFTGRSMKGMVYVAAEGIDDDAALSAWLDRGLEFTATLPPK